jgi:hypothetical protein
MVAWYPEAALGVAVVSNLGNLNVGEKAAQVAEAFLENRMKPKAAAAPAAPPKGVERVSVDPARLGRHAGVYRVPQLGIVEVELKDGKLLASPPGSPRQELVPIAPDLFFVQAMNLEVAFTDGETKKEIIVRPRQPPQTEQRGERLSTTMPNASTRDFTEYAGVYWSDELETQYRVVVEEGKVRLRHVRHGTVDLRPMFGDVFGGGSWFMSDVVFTRDAQGRVAGMRAGGGRVRGILFTRR